MTVQEFLQNHRADPTQLDARQALSLLLEDMTLGLAGEGNIPMIPSYLTADIPVPAGARCCVLDAGGTNLRTALAVFQPDGTCRLEGLQKQPMPGTGGELSFPDFYGALAAPLLKLGHFQQVGFCFSYNVTLDRTLDGKLDFWCKEVRVPEAVGRPVGASLKEALGSRCQSVHVLNDSVAAMLGAGTQEAPVDIGIILGTGVNVCYTERCQNIPKIHEPLRADAMIVSTEVGEFSKLPKSDFDRAVIDTSDSPENAQAEKQCSGGYLGSIITRAWEAAKDEALLPEGFCPGSWDLARISQALAEDTLDVKAAEIARQLISRAAKIAAILCAGPMILSGKPNLRVAVEGSQYWKLTGFREAFHRELDALLAPCGTGCTVVKAEDACLIGAARAAFAQPM